MTDVEILQAAIKKAIINGYKIHRLDAPSTILTDNNLAETFTKNNLYFTHIFSHAFAKNFWGEEPTEQGTYGQLPAWKYHLQQMILEKQPLKYLEKFLV